MNVRKMTFYIPVQWLRKHWGQSISMTVNKVAFLNREISSYPSQLLFHDRMPFKKSSRYTVQGYLATLAMYWLTVRPRKSCVVLSWTHMALSLSPSGRKMWTHYVVWQVIPLTAGVWLLGALSVWREIKCLFHAKTTCGKAKCSHGSHFAASIENKN